MEYKPQNTYHGFTLKETWYVQEIESDAYLFEHQKSGAALLYLANKDDNKVFSATFRTPSENSCGTAHILEHSVLCGSEKYPLKEPFVELIKSSLNTFLNAMTFPDKTMYPVASLNTADLLNLCDVYLDAVFNPLIKQRKNIFLQEGWHYHLENPLDELDVNGVVYNEMKGAYSSPMDLLENEIMKSLYPDTSYSFDSGGDPDVIPSLSYESFLAFYERYYHPSNCYLYLYGDMDVEPFLEKIDGFLDPFEKRTVDSMPALQSEFAAPAFREGAYSSSEGDDPNRSSYFAYSFRVGQAGDSLLSYAFNVLEGILFDSDASPLKKALLDTKIADEVTSEYTTCLRQPFFSIIAKNADIASFDIFKETVESTLSNLAENGIDPELIKSSLNSYEFDLREADSGNTPKGLLFLIDILESWLYGGHPTSHLSYENYLAILRENETSEYYQNLIREHLLDNPNKSLVRLDPKAGFAALKATELHTSLQGFKAGLADEEVAAIAKQTEELLIAQRTPDSQEARNSVPSLSLSDIEPVQPKPNFEMETHGASRVFTHTDNARGIVYLDLYFPFEPASPEDICLLELATKALATYKTQNYSEEGLAKEIGIYLGDAGAACASYPYQDENDGFESRLVYSTKALEANTPKMFEIASEILLRTAFDDDERLEQTISEELSKFDQKMLSMAHSMAVMRIMAFESRRGVFSDTQAGFAFYRFLLDAKKSLSQAPGKLAGQLSAAVARVVSGAPDVLITCGADFVSAAKEAALSFVDALPKAREAAVPFEPEPLGKKNEAVVTPSNVNYVAVGANYKKLGLEYRPEIAVVKKYLTSGYLWETLRVLGGAYGAMMIADKAGFAIFVSYRDPKLKETLAAYASVPRALEEPELSERDVEKLIIGTISDIDAPKPVYSVGRSLLSDYYRRESWEERMADRQAILSTTLEDIKSFAGFFEKVLAESSICVVGTQPSISQNEDAFDVVIQNLKQE